MLYCVINATIMDALDALQTEQALALKSSSLWTSLQPSWNKIWRHKLRRVRTFRTIRKRRRSNVKIKSTSISMTSRTSPLWSSLIKCHLYTRRYERSVLFWLCYNIYWRHNYNDWTNANRNYELVLDIGYRPLPSVTAMKHQSVYAAYTLASGEMQCLNFRDIRNRNMYDHAPLESERSKCKYANRKQISLNIWW